MEITCTLLKTPAHWLSLAGKLRELTLGGRLESNAGLCYPSLSTERHIEEIDSCCAVYILVESRSAVELYCVRK
jgi:hypothetical protein